MSYLGIASRSGTTSAGIEKLLATGKVSSGIAVRIGITSEDLTNFVEGTVPPDLAAALGTTTDNAQVLRDAIGRQGAIGLIVGMACGMAKR